MILEIVPNAMPAAEEFDVGLVTRSLNHIIHVLSGGYARISGATNALMWTLVVLDLTLFGIMVVLELDAWHGAFKKLLAISGWAYFIQDFEQHANAIVNSLVTVGLMLGGQSGSDWRLILDPSRILSKGFSLTAVLLENLPPWYQMGMTDWLGAGLAYVLIFAAFFIIAANSYILVIGFYMALAVCGALLPFGLLRWTQGFAMKGVTAVVAHGVHLMLVALVTALAETVIQNLEFAQGRPPKMHEIWSMVLVVGTLATLAWLVPQRFAQGFMHGAASLGAADVTAMARPAVAMALGAVGGAGVAVATQLHQAHGDRRQAGNSESGARISQSIPPAPASAAPGGGAASTVTTIPPTTGGPRIPSAGTAAPPSASRPGPNDPILNPPGTQP